MSGSLIRWNSGVTISGATGNQRRAAACFIAVKCDRFAADFVVFRTADDLAAVVARDRATAGVANAGDWNATHLEMLRARADDFATMRGCVAKPDHITHDWNLSSGG